jgi:hypothetical protein
MLKAMLIMAFFMTGFPPKTDFYHSGGLIPQ